MADTRELQVTVTMSWSQARALAYAADVGIHRWPKEGDEEYRDLAHKARQALLRDTARAERSVGSGSAELSVQGRSDG